MDIGVHLPQIDLAGEGLSLARLTAAARAAVEGGFAAVAANDHLVFSRPWLDGPTALAAVVGCSGTLDLTTSVALPTLRGPVPLAAALTALDTLSGGRVVAGVGAGSSDADLAAVGRDPADRWRLLDDALRVLRAELGPDRSQARLPVPPVRPGGIPLWVASWGSPAGLRRVARWGDGWLASAYHTDPARWASDRAVLDGALRAVGREPSSVGSALATMWLRVTDDAAEARRVVDDLLAPMLHADPDLLRPRVCVGPAGRCAELLAAYAGAGCSRVLVWPVGDEPHQLEVFSREVLPRLAG